MIHRSVHKTQSVGPEDKPPTIRRQVERICEAIGVDADDVYEVRIQSDVVHVFRHGLTPEGDIHFDDSGNPSQVISSHRVDTQTFIGDERDF